VGQHLPGRRLASSGGTDTAEILDDRAGSFASARALGCHPPPHMAKHAIVFLASANKAFASGVQML